MYINIISSVMHAFWLVLPYDLLKDRCIDDIIKTFFPYILILYYIKHRFQVAVHLFSNRSQRMSKCGKNISDTLGCASCATFCSYHILTSSVIYYWTDTWQLGIYLLNIYIYIYIYIYRIPTWLNLFPLVNIWSLSLVNYNFCNFWHCLNVYKISC